MSTTTEHPTTGTGTRRHLTALPAPIIPLHELRFDRALGLLKDDDPGATVTLDTSTTLAKALDSFLLVEMPPAADALPASDRSAAAAVIFIERYGALFGIVGWHAVTPTAAEHTDDGGIWFTFRAETPVGAQNVRVCTEGDWIVHVRTTPLEEVA